MDSELLYFLTGAIFIFLIVPILQEVVRIIHARAEVWINRWDLESVLDSVEAADTRAAATAPPANPIGFTVPDSIEEEDEEE